MTKRKPKELKSWIVRVREEVIRWYVVDAEDAGQAAEIYQTNASDVSDIETVNWEVEGVEPNE